MEGLTRPTIILGMSTWFDYPNRNQYGPISKNNLKRSAPEQLNRSGRAH